MRDYELLYIIKTELSEEQTQAVIDRYVGILEGEGATVEKVDKWGKRKLLRFSELQRRSQRR